MTSIPSASPDGPRVGKFACTERLGSGGMGEVWKAWDTELSRWVALKFLKGHDADEIARFKREAQTAGRLAHPNIAAIYELGETDGRPWIAMQYVPGVTLKKFPRGDRKLLVRLVRDAARAIAVAHAEGIIHRDLKPDNLMVVSRTKPATGRFVVGRSADEHHVFVMDFGLARAITSDKALSQSGMAIGTPAYMSPEQARGDLAAVGARSDVYGLGATLHEALAGRPP